MGLLKKLFKEKELSCVIIVKYKSDTDFMNRFDAAQKIIYRYGIVTAKYVAVVCSDYGLDAFIGHPIIENSKGDVENCFMLPCY